MAEKEKELHPLFCKAQAGDQKSYSELLTRIAQLATAYVRRKIGVHGDSDDVVQEILISVDKALHTYDPARKCMPWLAAIMHYRASDWLRSRYTAAQKGKVSLEAVEDFLAADVTTDPLEYEYINEAVGHLSDKQSAVIKAMYVEDLTVKETSQKLGMGVSAVKVTAHRAYKVLRKRINEQ